MTWYGWHRLCSCQAAWTTLRLEPATRMCRTRYPILFSRLEGHLGAIRSFSFSCLLALWLPQGSSGAPLAHLAKLTMRGPPTGGSCWPGYLARICGLQCMRTASYVGRAVALRFCDRVMRAAGFRRIRTNHSVPLCGRDACGWAQRDESTFTHNITRLHLPTVAHCLVPLFHFPRHRIIRTRPHKCARAHKHVHGHAACLDRSPPCHARTRTHAR